MSKLVNYYIVKKSTGVTYNPDFITSTGQLMIATSNRATENNPVVINMKKLIVGLQERRYRLVPKTI